MPELNGRSDEQVRRVGRWLALCLVLVIWVPAVEGQFAHSDLRTFNLQRQAVGKAYVDPIVGEVGSSQGPLSACPNNTCPGLGNGFYLPAFNSLSVFTGGAQIFQNRTLGTCVTFSPTATANRQFNVSSDSASFFNEVATEADIKGSYDTLALTFGATFQSITNFQASTQFATESLALNITYLTGVLDFQQNSTCWTQSNVNPSFLAAFTQLPPVGDPTQPASWTPYINFLQTWGSHIMVQQSLGSRFQQWESALSSSGISVNTLEAKACADVEGLSQGGGWSVSGCAAFSSAQKQAAESAVTTEKEIIIGGTQETRKNLLNGVTQQTLAAFVDSADQADEAVEHQWVPIWTLLAALYGPGCTQPANCDNYQRALNLEAAYEGWLAVGCPTISSSVVVAQNMQVASTDTTTGIKTYGCWVNNIGCTSGASCHGGGFLGSACYCYGPGCITTGSPAGDPSNPVLFHPAIQFQQTGSYDEGVNNTCYHYGFTCNCNFNYLQAATYIWQQSGSEALSFLRKSDSANSGR